MKDFLHMRAGFAMLGLLLVMSFGASAQTLIDPGTHASTYTGYTRGYYFTAPIDMVITRIDIPTDASSTGSQTAEILSFASAPPTSGSGTQLGYWNGVAATGTITTNISVKQGEVIGVLGHRYTATTAFGAINSYTGVRTVNIDGNTVTLYRFGHQGNIAGGASNGANLITATTGSIGRVNVYWQYPISGSNNASVLSVDSPDVFCPGVKDVYATIKNEGENQIDSVRVNWSINGVRQSTIYHTTTLDTLKGRGSSSAQIKLGSHNFSSAATVKVWTSMPNGVRDTVNLGDTIEVDKGPSLAGTFTIGGTSPDYRDFEEAADDLSAFGVCGPVTFNVAAGTYSNRMVLKDIAGTSATNTITFAGAGSSGTTKTTLNNRAASSETRTTLVFDDADWVTIKDIEIIASGASWGNGVQFMNGSDHNTVEGCVITTNSTSTSTNFVAIVGSNSATGRTAGNTGNWNTIKNNVVTGGYYNVWFYGPSLTNKAKGNRFEDNTFDDAYYYGIYMFNHDSIVFNGNRIRGLRQTSFADGIYAYYWSNMEFSRNDIVAPDYGVYFVGLNRDNYNGTTPSMISNNTLVSNSDYAFYATSTSRNFDFYHNSLYSTGLYTCYFNVVTNVGIDNNIFTNNRSGGYTVYIRVTTPNSLDYNIYHNFNTGGRIANHNGIYTTFADYQTGVPAFNENSLSQDPGFINRTGNLRLTPSNASPRAIDVGILDDVDGDTRCRFAPTIGADEGLVSSAPLVAGFQKLDTIWQNSFTTILNTASASDPKGHTWYVNGVMVSNELHLTDTFKTAGQVIIKLVTEGCSGTDSLIDTLVVSAATKKPIASFVASKTDPLIYENMQLIDISTEGPTSYQWRISPASIGGIPTYTINSGSLTSPNPEIEFDYEGTYDVCLIVRNAFGADSLCRTKFIQIKTQQLMCVFPSETQSASGLFFDDGGPTRNHASNQNCGFLINPCAREVAINFSSFALGTGDYLRIYDGEDATTGTPLWDVANYPNGMEGNTTSGSYKSNYVATSGKMYLQFVSNGVTTGAGWEAEWTSKPNLTAALATSFFTGPDTVCVDIPVAYNNESTGDDMEFEWIAEGFSQGTVTDLGYTFNTVGTYNVSLEVTNCAGTSTYTKSVVVETPKTAPTPDFDVSNDKPIVGERVTLTDLSNYCRDIWEWTITPNTFTYVTGSNANSQNPVVQFNSAGNYTVKQLVGNATASDSITKTNVITVLAYCNPTVAFKSTDLGISRVLFADIDNSSDVGVDAYTDYSETIGTKMEIGATYSITVERDNNNFPMTRKVWIDYNRDGDFNDAGELVASEAAGYALSWTASITTPSTAIEGITRMRIGTNSGSNANVACGPHFNGEFEDYRINISPDIAAPVVTLTNGDTIVIGYCDTYTEPGATAIDNVDGNISSSIVYGGTVLRKAGDYELTYYSVDANNNETEVTRVVTREGNKTPIQITMNGQMVDTIEVLTNYTDPGFTTSHPCAGVSVSNTLSSLDNQVLGSYTITYEVEDSFGNKSTAMRTVRVLDRTAPTLTYTGNDTIEIDVNTPFTVPTVTVLDNFDGSPKLTTLNNVDNTVVGEYSVTFCAIDGSDNQVCENIVVHVLDRIDPVVTLKGNDTVYVDVYGSYNDRGVEITDNYYTMFSTVTSGDWVGETDVLGTFTQTYNVTDGSANSASVSRTIIVVDRESPRIWLNGDAVVYLERWEDWTDPGAVATDNYDTNPTIDDASGSFVNTQSEGIYDVTYFALDQSGNRSSSITRTIIVDKTTSVPRLDTKGVEIYPNPTTGLAVIEMDLNANAPMTLWITDISGKTMFAATQIAPSTEKFELNISDLNDGVYFMHLQTSSQHVIKRIVKQ